MKIINIGGKDYTFEFTIEASLYKDCAENISNLMISAMDASNREDIKAVISSITDIPYTALTMFYAGLMEHHGKDGDGTILNIGDAKKLIKTYFNEHKDDDTGNFYGIMELMMQCMADDDFFKQIGLEQMMKQSEQSEKKPKTPTDHKKKSVNRTGN